MHVKVLLKRTALENAYWQRVFLAFTFLLFASLGVQAQNAYTDAGKPVPTVTSDKDDYAPGEVAIITGSGWILDSLVDIHLEEEPSHDHHHGYHDTKVNADGTWEIRYQIEERHLGVKFTVIVDGKQTGYQGLAYFTDGVKAPTSLTATASSTDRSITLSWTVSGDASNDNYVVERCEGGDCTNYVELVTTTSTTVLDTGLKCATTYSYRVRARKVNPGNGSIVYSDPVLASTTSSGTLSTAFTSVSASPAAICPGGSSTLSASGGTAGTGAVTKWYTDAAGTNELTSATVSPTATTTYYVRREGTCGNTSLQSVTVTVNTPVALGNFIFKQNGAIVAAPNVKVGTPLTIEIPYTGTLPVTASFTLEGTGATIFINGNEISTANGMLSTTFTFTTAQIGVYALTANISNSCGLISKRHEYVVAFEDGMVTGGGWITSPAVSVDECSTCSFMPVGGKANFGFVAKPKKAKPFLLVILSFNSKLVT